MQTALSCEFKDTRDGQDADAILRSCVHCGFCTATCPTYQLLGDELDGPRGRIYLIKGLVEGKPAGRGTQVHLDRCLTCRACETTCPSGVAYGRLLDIGRKHIEAKVRRPFTERILRYLLRKTLPYPRRFVPLLRLGQWLRPLLPAALRGMIPAKAHAVAWQASSHPRKMLLFAGCVQPWLTPNTNRATARVLNRLGIRAVTPNAAGCCGAISHHMAASDEARVFARRNIDAWWPHLESGFEAIVCTASGCGAMIKDYPELLCEDPHYARKAERISAVALDLCEVLGELDLALLTIRPHTPRRIAFHSPCTLQHAQQLNGVTETLLRRLGFDLTRVPNGHLCCGSAGVYSLLQRTLSQPLQQNKVAALQSDRPQLIATANVGCQMVLQPLANVPVRHWIELLDP
ncbi:MAG: glycolate oxidase subunit GlcF [Gammaproteobacteria bacterium]|nr:glycolate oxidase subunit GlcF [Gammaproteobacteria bacterium]